MFAVVRVKRRGWFTDAVVIRALGPIHGERVKFRWDKVHAPRAGLLHLRIDRGESLDVRLPHSLRGRTNLTLDDVANVRGIRERWELVSES